MKQRILQVLALAVAILALQGGELLSNPAALALSGSNFNPGRIIDDAVFTNGNAMSVQAIQGFLNAKVPSCDTNGNQPYYGTYGGHTYNGNILRKNLDSHFPPPYTCLKDYYENPTTHANNYGGQPIPEGAQTAAQIIYNAAQTYSINPETLIVLIQKESSLITDDWPWPNQYKTATGYGCPDGAPCDSQYFGFSNQVTKAAFQFRRYINFPTQYNYLAGQNNNILYNPKASCGYQTVFIQNQATAALYDYTPYVPNQAALSNLYGLGDGCSSYGNRNFWRLFNDWFGSTLIPAVLKSDSSPTVYVYSGGYKFVVPSMAMLQDYGYDPNSVASYPQSYVDAIPSADQSSGVSPSLSYLVKTPSDSDADGGMVYMVSVGKKYPFASMSQFNGFGFSEANISYLPANYLGTIPTANTLSNFVYAPNHATFEVANGKKQIIFDHPTYLQLNPSDTATPLSYYLADSIISAEPIVSRDVLIRSTTGAIYLLSSHAYYLVYSMDVYNCWGFGATQDTPLYQLAQDNYVAVISYSTALGCVVSDSQSNQYLLNKVNKLPTSPTLGFTPMQGLSSDIIAIYNRLPTVSNLNSYIKPNNSSAVWYLVNGTKRVIPTYSDFLLLGLTSAPLSILDSSVVNTIPGSGIKLGSGQVVKADNSPAVFIVSGDTRLLFNQSEVFFAYKYTFDQIETVSAGLLDQLYPYQNTVIGRYLYDQSSGSVFMIDAFGCYKMSTTQVADFGQNYTSLSGQSYNSNIFKNLSLPACPNLTNYVKTSDQSVVYWVKDGSKSAFLTWNSLVAHAGTNNPPVTVVSHAILDPIPTGPPMQ